ncbi:hypothetical protein SDJN03_13984, partial [Cucurbita argyrosperma subsp. sororia]
MASTLASKLLSVTLSPPSSLEALRIHFEDRKLQRRPAPTSSESSWNRKNEERVQSSLEACVKDDAD